MSHYLIQIGEALANVLENAGRAQADTFVGYFGNIQFWIDELRHLRTVERGFGARFETMQRLQKEFVEESGGYRNLGDEGLPRQRVTPTSHPSQRKKIVSRNEEALRRIIRRGFEIGLIDISRHDELLDQIDRESV